ncbi:MAG: DinB family protein [Acidimicrobiales bacterium]
MTTPASPDSPPPPPITPDDKNWTWVLERTCPDCGFDTNATPASAVPGLLRAQADEWVELLAHPHARLRPTADQWSALEYGCHVRDVFRLYEYRLGLMLGQDDPHFPNWDQDETAVSDRYDLQDPATVADELRAAALSIADAFEAVRPDQWQRTGVRSDGAVFTIDTFTRYFVHDPIHHLDDVRRGNEILASGDLD